MYGLPGCGKTTQCQLLKENANGRRIGYLTDVFDEFRKRNFFYKIFHIPYGACFVLFQIFLFSPKLPISEKNVYIAFLRHVISYGNIKNYAKYDYVIADHGIIQSVASLFYRNESSFSNLSSRILLSLLKKIKFDYLIWCDVSVETSIRRIRTRNRNFGRLDAIMSEEQLNLALKKEYDLFLTLNKIIAKEYSARILQINMESDPQLIHNVLNKIIS